MKGSQKWSTGMLWLVVNSDKNWLRTSFFQMVHYLSRLIFLA